HPDLDRICRKLPIICQVPANASTTFRFKPLLQKALRIVQVRLGITLAAYDVIRIAASSVMHYNRLVKNEDRINDATTGSFG
ncbi:hypothetical protein AB4Y34_23280, partial [Paraburkholderia sp. BR10954]